jgi:folate-binding protein YgfZ
MPIQRANDATLVASLADRALLRVGGADAAAFLQGLVTCDIDGMGIGEARFGALLTPQGKILFDFFVIRSQESFILDIAATMRDDLQRRLQLYKLRAKVEIEPFDPRTGVHASWGGDPPLVDAHRIGLGMPEGGADFAFGTTFPHEALMDQNAGVDFAKGCFVGQEVVSRMQHRGTARSRFVRVIANAPLPPPSTPVLAGAKSCGQMGSSAGTVGLALVRIDRAAEAKAQGINLTAGTTAIEVRIPEWAKFQWPAAA